MKDTLLFTTPKERLAVRLSLAENPAQMDYSDPWTVPRYAGIYGDKRSMENDTAMLLLIAAEKLALEKNEEASRFTRGEIIETPSFERAFCHYRRLADLHIKILLAENARAVENRIAREAGKSEDTSELEATKDLADYVEKFPDPDSKELLENILKEAEETRDELEREGQFPKWGQEEDPTPKGTILSPKESAQLAAALVGGNIKPTRSLRRHETPIALWGPNTKGTVTDVTETEIFVDWDDEREFHLIHGVDEYQTL